MHKNHLADRENRGRLCKTRPEVFADMLGCIETQTVDIVFLDKIADPVVQSLDNRWILGIQVGEENEFII